MNRQVIPSMILSVLIVCFFSIVLYQRDKPEVVARHAGGQPTPAATPVSTTRNVEKPATPPSAASQGPDSSKVVDEGPPREVEGRAKTETPPVELCRSPRPQISPAAGLEKADPVRVAEQPAVPAVRVTDGPGSAPSQVATRSANPVNRPKEKPASDARLRPDKYWAPVGVHHGQGGRDAGRRGHPDLRLVRPARPALEGQPGSTAPQEFSAERGRRAAYAPGMTGSHPWIAEPDRPRSARVTFRQRCGSR